MKHSIIALLLLLLCEVPWGIRLDAGDVIGVPVENQEQLGDEFPTIANQADRVFSQLAEESDEILACIDTCQPASDKRDWYLLPDGLIWHSYLAGPHEPRISSVIFHTSDGDVFWDATLGGRVGLIRYGTPGAVRPQGWQWDLEGAVITRLDLLHAEDVESMDYRFGTEITAGEGPWRMKFGYFHISSHVGDEYVVRFPNFKRINYVTESLVQGVSYSPSQAWRFYGEMAYAFRASGGATRFQFQNGIEYTPVASAAWYGAPFAAINWDFREAVGYRAAMTAQLGWSFQGPRSDRRLRFGAQYGNGPTSQFEFFRRVEEYVGGGVWFDY